MDGIDDMAKHRRMNRGCVKHLRKLLESGIKHNVDDARSGITGDDGDTDTLEWGDDRGNKHCLVDAIGSVEGSRNARSSETGRIEVVVSPKREPPQETGEAVRRREAGIRVDGTKCALDQTGEGVKESKTLDGVATGNRKVKIAEGRERGHGGKSRGVRKPKYSTGDGGAQDGR